MSHEEAALERHPASALHLTRNALERTRIVMPLVSTTQQGWRHMVIPHKLASEIGVMPCPMSLALVEQISQHGSHANRRNTTGL